MSRNRAANRTNQEQTITPNQLFFIHFGLTPCVCEGFFYNFDMWTRICRAVWRSIYSPLNA